MADSNKSRDLTSNIRKGMNSLGEVDVAADMLWGAQKVEQATSNLGKDSSGSYPA
jgi:hypothetical protein